MKLFFITLPAHSYLTFRKKLMDYAACSVAAAPVRKRPSHKVEMVNQLLFGESMCIIKKKKNWFKIESFHDNYEGWIRNNLVTILEDGPLDSSLVATDLFNQLDIGGVKLHIPIGSSLPAFDGERGRFGTLVYEYKGNRLDKTKIKPNAEIIGRLTGQWMNAPYLWGGRTPLGVDCSGFVQVVFKMIGIDLLRDAWQQQGQGIKVKKLAGARCGDLVFFEARSEKITHVGILLSADRLVHASGKVRVDELDEKGIINSDTGKRTHSLAAIRRYW